MKKFIVDVIYSGSIMVEINAENEADARIKAELRVDGMNNEEFLYTLSPTHAETNIIEEIEL